MKINQSFVAGLALVSSVVSGQAFAAFEDPSTASWGGWNRGDTGTTYAHWDDFALDGVFYLDGTTPADNTPDVGSNNILGGPFAGTVALNPSTLVTSTQNLYTPGGPGVFLTYFQEDFYSGPNQDGNDPVTVALQIATAGSPLNAASVSLTNGGSSTLAADSALDRGNGEWLFLWNLAGSQGSYGFNYSGTASHMSLIEVSVDIGATAVPVPAAAWLFGSALLGLGVVRRK